MPILTQIEEHPDDLNVVTLLKGPQGKEEKYIFLFCDANRLELERVLENFALNPELSFALEDIKKVMDQVQQTDQQSESTFEPYQEWNPDKDSDDGDIGALKC